MRKRQGRPCLTDNGKQNRPLSTRRLERRRLSTCAIRAWPRKPAAQEAHHVNADLISTPKANELRHTSYSLWIQEIGIRILHFTSVLLDLGVCFVKAKSLSASEIRKATVRWVRG